MGKLLDQFPWWADLLLLLVFVGGLVAAKTGYDRYQQGIGADRVRAEWNAEKVVQQQAALKEGAANAAETQRRLSAMQGVINEQATQIARERADADAARASRGRLLDQQAKFIASARGSAGSNPAPGPVSQTTGDALDLLSNLFSESDEASGILAQALDAAHSAGLACQRSYEALTAH